MTDYKLCITCQKPITTPSRVARGDTKCWKCQHPTSGREQRVGRRYKHAQKKANKRGKLWSLTREEYETLIAQPCYYCEGVLGKVTWEIGLDRLDNSKGYEHGNCVSCCEICNKTRGEAWTPQEAKAMIQAGLAYRKQVSP